MEGKLNKTIAMKAKFTVVMLVAIIFVSCNKDEDYRDNFIGKYNCAVISEFFSLPEDFFVYNWYDTLTVTMAGDSSICISFIAKTPLKINVSVDGHFGNEWESSFGYFEGNNLYLTESTDGRGGNITTKYYGKKIK